MPAGTPTPTTLHYANAIEVALSANKVDLTSSALRGHRVQVPIDVSVLNNWFTWTRAANSNRPLGRVAAQNVKSPLVEAVANVGFNDVDGSAGGLDFSTASFPSGDLTRIHASGTPAPCMNDLVVAYILYKCYGKTAIDTTAVFNIEDTQDLLDNDLLYDNLVSNLTTEETKASTAANPVPDDYDAGAVDQMFRDLLSADPMRFFDASGNQITGLFETNTATSGNGTWHLVAGDIIEIAVNVTFGAAVSSRGFVAGTTTMEATASGETVAINSADAFSLRLQLLAQ